MVWRLVLSLFLHITLLLFLAIYLELALNSVRTYSSIISHQEVELESLNIVPALLGAMDTQWRAWQKDGDMEDRALYAQFHQNALDNLNALNSNSLLATSEEIQRRALAHQWLSEIGDNAMKLRMANPADIADLTVRSHALLDQINQLTAQVRKNTQAALTALQDDEARQASGLVNLMWIGVLTVSLVTILFQLFVANSIIGPIQTLASAVRRMQSGDLSVRVYLHSGDEIEHLGETFNSMAENIVRNQRDLEESNVRLSTQQEALRTANTGLEERVDEKTRELADKNQKLSEAARLKDEFLATLSHELRTPLTPVISCAHLLATDPAIDSTQLRNVQVIDRNARALSRMIDELLDLSAVINHKLRLDRERTEMNEWARATLETLRPTWEKKDLRLDFYPSPQPVELDIDPTRLAQVLTNLLTNAIKYTPPHGHITVNLTRSQDEVRVAVSDTGAGLKRHEIDQIFEMFHQSRTPHTQNVGGLGVGLTVARSLAELHGGGLLAESPGPGQGATFTLWLPTHPSLTTSQTLGMANGAPAPLASATNRSLLRGRRILIVEDSTDTREALERIFLRRECQVTTAGSAEEALERVLHDPPEIMISDIGLPGMSGLELMTQLRARPEFQDVIAIALSGLGRERDIQGATDAGFNAHLLKPVDITVLDQTLISALQK